MLVLRLLSYVLVLREIQGPSSNSDHWFQLPVPVILVNDCAVRNKIMNTNKNKRQKTKHAAVRWNCTLPVTHNIILNGEDI